MRLRTQSSSPPRGGLMHLDHNNSSSLLPTTSSPTNHHHHPRLNGSRRRRAGRRKKDDNDNSVAAFGSSQQQVVISRSAIRTFGVLAILFLVSVHLYLFQILLTRTHPSSSREEATTAAVQAKVVVGPDTEAAPGLFQITPLRPVDREQYTIRINAFQRLEQLNISIHHHLSCGDAVAQIQVVWCLEHQGEPPPFLEEISPKVVLERHEVNSLNERFHIMTDPTPTLGILSIDDDVLRPCTAIDSGFFRWTGNPERMVGFDARTHVVETEKDGDQVWKYGYMSTTEHSNRYSLTLPRYAFLHKDYMDYYTKHMPRSVYKKVAENFNCEDIAMSFLVSSLTTTSSRAPLLADFWAVRSMIKLYTESKISSGKSHKAIRDECVEEFATTLGLKGKLHHAKLKHKDHFEYGDRISTPTTAEQQQNLPPRQVAFQEQLERWKNMPSEDLMREWTIIQAVASKEAYVAGLLQGTEVWKERWHGGPHDQQQAEEEDDRATGNESDLVLPHVVAPRDR